MNSPTGPESTRPLDDEEVQYVRKKIRQEQAMGAVAKRFRDWVTFFVLLIGAFALFWDQFKAMVRAAQS